MSKATEAFERIENLPNSYRSQEVWNYCYMVDCGIVERELSYADKCHNLEEHIGCPLEVRLQINCDTIIYDDNGNEYEVDYVYKNNFVCHNGQCDDFGCDYEFTFNWKDYKKTWWLRKDKSE